MVRGQRIYVVGDDECGLGIFSIDSTAPGKLVPLLPDVMPADAKERKAVKPDFEVLLELPADRWPSTLLALGSGSTDRRCRGVRIPLDDAGQVGEVEVIDLADLYQAVATAVAEVNVEGAVVRDELLLLFNRGNGTNPDNTVVAVSVDSVLAGRPVTVEWSKVLEIPRANNVPLSVTDAYALDDAALVLSAVAEDTADTYNDGELVGAALVVLDADLRTVTVEQVTPTTKLEGVHARRTEARIEILAVADPDDPAVSGQLFSCSLVAP